MVDAAIAAGVTPPSKRGTWLAALAAGGTRGGQAIFDLLRSLPADPATRAAWAAQGGQVRADAAADDDDRLFAQLYPDNEQAAAAMEARIRQQARDAARFAQSQDYSATLAAGGPGGELAGGHGKADTVHAHDHADYGSPPGTHTHVHVHRGDSRHGPGAGHTHDGEPSAPPPDPAQAGIAARRRAAAAAGDPAAAATDEDLFRRLFGT